jgi:hypothetical protein
MMLISFPEDSKVLVEAIRSFIDASVSRGHPLIQWQCLLGWVNWALNIFPLLRPALQSSYSKIAGKSIAKATVHLNRAVISNLSWLTDTIIAVSNGLCLLNSVIWGVSNAYLVVFCNVSLEAMGFYVPELSLSFFAPIPLQTSPHHIFFYEALCLVSAVGLQPPPHRLLITPTP